MESEKQQVIASFDALARLDSPLWNHNRHYYRRALAMVTQPDASILDIGCGDGDFAALASQRGWHCTGIDFSQGMIDKALQRPEAGACDFICGDVYEVLPTLAPQSFDAAFSFAAMHHMDYETLLPVLRRVMKPGSFFCVVDLVQSATPWDYLCDICAILPNRIKKRMKNRAAWQSGEESRLWHEHGKLDTYPRLSELRKLMSKLGVRYRLKRLLYYRYMLVINF